MSCLIPAWQTNLRIVPKSGPRTDTGWTNIASMHAKGTPTSQSSSFRRALVQREPFSSRFGGTEAFCDPAAARRCTGVLPADTVMSLLD
jgi:hypothetical protein